MAAAVLEVKPIAPIERIPGSTPGTLPRVFGGTAVKAGIGTTIVTVGITTGVSAAVAAVNFIATADISIADAIATVGATNAIRCDGSIAGVPTLAWGRALAASPG